MPFVKPKIEYNESHETTKLKDTSGGIDEVSKSNTDVGTQQLTKVAADSKETSDKVADNAREEDEDDDDDVFEKSTLNAAANAVIGTVDGSGLDDNEDLESELSPFLSTREQLHGRRHPFFVDRSVVNSWLFTMSNTMRGIGVMFVFHLMVRFSSGSLLHDYISNQ